MSNLALFFATSSSSPKRGSTVARRKRSFQHIPQGGGRGSTAPPKGSCVPLLLAGVAFSISSWLKPLKTDSMRRNWRQSCTHNQFRSSPCDGFGHDDGALLSESAAIQTLVTMLQRSVRRTTTVHITTQSPETRGRRVEAPTPGNGANVWQPIWRRRQCLPLDLRISLPQQQGSLRTWLHSAWARPQLPASQMRCTRLHPSGGGAQTRLRDRRTEPRGPSIGTTSLSSVGGLDEQSEDGGLQSMWTHGEQALQQRHAPHMFVPRTWHLQSRASRRHRRESARRRHLTTYQLLWTYLRPASKHVHFLEPIFSLAVERELNKCTADVIAHS